MKLFNINKETGKHARKKEKEDVSLTYKSLISSFIAMLLCAGLFIGTSFAWFADSKSNTNNKIQTGIMSVELLDNDGNDLSGNSYSIFDSTTLETPLSPVDGSDTYTSNKFYIVNNGDLNSEYQLWLNVTESKTGAEIAEEHNVTGREWATGRLEDALKITVKKDDIAIEGLENRTISDIMGQCLDSAIINKEGAANDQSAMYQIVVSMPHDLTDIDKYQGASLKFSVIVLASQSYANENAEGTVTIVPSAFQKNADNPEISKIRLYSSSTAETAMYYCNKDGLTRTQNGTANTLTVEANPTLSTKVNIPKVEFTLKDGTVDSCIVKNVDFYDTSVVFDDNSVVTDCTFTRTSAMSEGQIVVTCKGHVTFRDCKFNDVIVRTESGGKSSYEGSTIPPSS